MRISMASSLQRPSRQPRGSASLANGHWAHLPHGMYSLLVFTTLGCQRCGRIALPDPADAGVIIRWVLLFIVSLPGKLCRSNQSPLSSPPPLAPYTFSKGRALAGFHDGSHRSLTVRAPFLLVYNNERPQSPR